MIMVSVVSKKLGLCLCQSLLESSDAVLVFLLLVKAAKTRPGNLEKVKKA